MKRTIALNFVIILTILASLVGCATPNPTVTSQPSPLPSPTNDSLLQLISQKQDLAPQVIASTPLPGQTLALNGQLTLSFDQPMNQADTISALSVTDASEKPVEGIANWQNPRLLVFKPARPLIAGATYQARLGTGARSALGQPISQALAMTFQTAGALQVSQVFPANAALSIENQAAITVMFSQPVVPLVIAEQQAALVNPLVLDPPVSGRGEWINTSMFVFHPTQLLVGGQTYRATVKAGLVDATGEQGTALASDYTWSFSVAAPSVSAITLNDADLADTTKNVPLNPTIVITFRQPMDLDSVASGLKLLAGSTPVPYQAKWDEAHTQVELKLGQLLALNTQHTLVLDGLKSTDGGSLAALRRSFLTVPYPSILKTTPANGSVNSQLFVQLFFAGPMEFKSLAGKVVFSPELDTATHSYYNPYDNSLSFYGLQASTRYTVQVQPGMRDPFGNTIQQPLTLTFTTRPFEPSAMLQMPYQPIYRADGPQDFYLTYVNLNSYNVSLYRLTFNQFVQASRPGKGPTFQPPDTSRIWQVNQQKPGGKPDEQVLQDLTLTDANGKPLPTGYYFLTLQASPVNYNGPYLDSRLIFVSSDAISVKVSPGQLMAWVTGLTSGQPTPGAEIKVYDQNYTQVASGVTDANGLAQVSIDTTFPDGNSNDKSNFNAYWTVFVDGAAHFGAGSSSWGAGVSSGGLGLYDQAYRPWLDATAYVYTERPLYRPGQPVYFKGIVRMDNDLAYSLPDQQSVEVTISSFKEKVYTATLPLSQIGTFSGSFTLDPEAALGSYSLEVRWPGSTNSLNSVSFDVAEYRRPEFQVSMQAAPTNLLAGDAFKVDIAASYYSGGGLANAKVDWTLTSDPFNFNPPPDYNTYTFSDVNYDDWSYYSNPQSKPGSQIATGTAQTDADGKLSLPLTAQPAKDGSSQSLTFEATLTDFSGSSVSGQAKVVMHKSAVYPGVRAKSYVGVVNQPQTVELVALDWDGKPLAGAKVDVQIVERRWYSVQQEGDNGQLTWKTTVEDIPVTSFSDVTLDAKGLGSVSFTPTKGGIYRARVIARDAKDNNATAATFLWVAGAEYIPWAQTNDRSFQLVADRPSYKPGDTAELLIASPFQGESYALVTVERGHVRKAEVVHLAGNSTLYKLPITPDMAPNVYVSVLVVKGVDDTNPRPNFKVGLVRLQVDLDAQTLKVTIQANQPQAAPRQQVQYTVQTTTLDGTPVQAEVSMALSDLATLSLKDSTVPTLLNFFYAPRSLSVVTGVSIVQSIEDFNAAISKQNAADGRGAGSGGGKGGGAFGVIEVRQDFPDTAFWQAQVQTGVDGKASVLVTLPDNLTTWRMDARAVTTDTRVGQATFDLVSTKPLLIRPQTPRFFVAGDRATLGAAVHNNTAQELSITVKLDALGAALQGPAEQTIVIPATRQALVTWDVTIPDGEGRVDLTFSVQGGGYTDATMPTLASLPNGGIPVYRYEAPETVGTSGILSDNTARTESISLPPDMTVQKGQLHVELAPSLAAGMTDGLTYLEQYPYEYTEQVVSRFLPNVRLSQALKAAGVQDASLEASLKVQIDLAIQKLFSRQNADGGWGWWGGMDSDVLVTAYTVLGLSEARGAGYTVSDAPMARAVTYLQGHFSFLGDLAPASQLNRQAFVLYVLARAGYPDVSRTVQLYDQRQSMALYARAFVLQTLAKIDPQDARLATIISDLNTAAILSAAGTHWEEKDADGWNWNTDLRSTAIILGALIETDPKSGLNPNAVRWLMANRQSGRWKGTQETAWSLLALTDWVSATGDLAPDYRYAVSFNGSVLAQGSASPQTVRQTNKLSVDVTQILSSQLNRLVFGREGSAGSLYYTAYLNLWLPVNQVQPLDRGLVISRQYFRPDDLSHPVTQAAQGDVLLARLTVVAPSTLRYLLVADPLPGGMEAVDPSLKTNPQAIQPDTYDWKRIDTDGWGWWFFSHIEYRDEKVVLSTDMLPPGTYVYTYLVRASTPGTFNVIPPTAQEAYFPDVYGRGAGSQFVITP